VFVFFAYICLVKSEIDRQMAAETQTQTSIKKKKNGKTIGCWINSEQQKLLVEKYGKVPDSKIILHVLLEQELKIITPEINKLQIKQEDYIYELKRIGRNLNQLMKLLHKRKLTKYASTVVPLIKKLNNHIFSEEQKLSF